MEIRVYATLRQLAGGKILQAQTTPPTTVRNILHAATAGRPKLEEEVWDHEGNLREHIRIFVSGRAIEHLSGLDTLVCEGDTVDVFPPVGGGTL